MRSIPSIHHSRRSPQFLPTFILQRFGASFPPITSFTPILIGMSFFPISIWTFFFLLILSPLSNSEPCPAFFGDSQCPESYRCVVDKCQNEQGMAPPTNCAQLKCGKDAECRDGKCIPFSGRPCGRNVLVAEGVARTVVSECGARGKCVGGRCTVDNCAEVLCDEMIELCRDGMCMSLSSMFCFSPFDCGPPSLFECRMNKCQRRKDTIAPSLSAPSARCDPGETFDGQKCVVQEGCAQLVCPSGQHCFNGFCVLASSGGSSCSYSGDCPALTFCREGRCVPDICKINGGSKCPPEHACSSVSVPEGECRVYQGIPCSHLAATDDCPPPYFCIGGICAKDECYRKVCQIGERCDGGLCIRVEGNSCRDAMRDCGEHFACEMGYCKEKIGSYGSGGAAVSGEPKNQTAIKMGNGAGLETVGGGGAFGTAGGK